MKESENQTPPPPLRTDPFAATCAMLMLRLWLGIRCLQSGIEKYAGITYISEPTEVDGEADPNGMETVIELKTYAFDKYQAMPSTMAEKFKHEPFIGEFFLGLYTDYLGPALILVGLFVLIGLASRVSLLAMGLIYTSLTYGLILLNQAPGVAWLGTHISLIALALILASYNRFELGNLIARRNGMAWLRDK